ncbi:probable LRR receptor-like serine/threonine-protein kinase At3g47570 isoform X1 [Solanum pennellii]|uniref:Probable LRR receptor-like serine/threonine-protein kinase At3g47570 isoform X1 n=1 Tax=Solanum pennellii TaxID=28526 RepID=A0ABM1V2U0_SOLPN|nr:probable LRR receptor-like serine/threonine-protein kinase At3g47570 isoform X1 [Solanum pennellii]XP_027770055.1 probable LRR receptor-like serine/threonine-protein kinase At3g47570 isoform X1 [Solanum pennellii]XP_027770056.1 probable LRR receptor-like serine/threonine-protein kinase At3g47570 isoform X1 [Solanum pennellii]XP_027770057.1 probable LRR receptor-like serine/threonine-protein kinase At3g47570 isoform X1 [Solanum pennellii]XP_027770058.1 probable LRR receptor-like serine/threon
MSALRAVVLDENMFSGNLPADLGSGIPSLETLICANNNLSGFISATISNASRLGMIDLSINSFTGPIPQSLGNLENLEVLNLQMNNFVSDSALSFLSSLTHCRKLIELRFAKNPLEGFFPASIGNFSDSLQIFEGWTCKLKGSIPREIGNLTGVIRINFSQNNLTGHIPKTIQGMLNLQEFYLESNKIEGIIPDVICNLKKLGALYLSGNQFSGRVPPCLGKVTMIVEYGQDGIVSTSCDVYSFGILMMETFTRIRPGDERFTGDLSIRRWVSDSFPNEIQKVVDANLVQLGDERIDAKIECLLSIIELALSCTLATPDARIGMEDSLSTLEKIRLQFVNRWN